MKLLGVSGKIGTGKTTLANYIANLAEGEWEVLSFADLLRIEVSGIFNIPFDSCRTQEGKLMQIQMPPTLSVNGLSVTPPKNLMTVREILQWWGTGVRRKTEPGYWVRNMKERVIALEKEDLAGVIIDDVRFLDEAGFVKKHGGGLIRLNPYESWTCDPAAAAHISEKELDIYCQWDFLCAPPLGALVPAAVAIMNMFQIKLDI